ncbi:MAG TPA: PIG-L deacetylase family protein [Candidatus Krumholzibacteria bacterium]|nr:PIG-L deacetylase family protein [Candidatus Krumholzibacteria bacterium]
MKTLAVGSIGSILCLGAHSDDIEIGCGGTVLKLVESNPGLSVHWVVFSATGERGGEARASADRFLARAGRKTVELHQFRDGFFPSEHSKIKTYFEELKSRVQPDAVFTHARADLHQDHRAICELTWNTFRDHLVLEYEVPKWDGDLGAPNVYVPLDERHANEKIAILLECFASQRGKHWFDQETFAGLMRLRAMECNAPSRRAEAFYGRKVVL